MTTWDVLPGPRHELAEEPSADGAALVYVDVPRGEVWSRSDLLAEPLLTHQLDGPISAARPTLTGLVVAARSRVLRLQSSGQHALATLPHDPSRWQVNGLVVLPDGAVVLGLLSRDRSEVGETVLLRDGVIVARVAGVRAANGLCVDPYGTAVWQVDTYARTLTRFEVGSDRLYGEVVSDFGELPGRPDGIGPAADGGIWVAMWDGGVVAHIAADGTVGRVFETPVSRPTCPVQFAGSLVVTTARTDADDEELGGRLLVTPLD